MHILSGRSTVEKWWEGNETYQAAVDWNKVNLAELLHHFDFTTAFMRAVIIRD